MTLTLAFVALALVAVGLGYLYWRKSRHFRAEVFIENLRLWREIVSDVRTRAPPTDPSVTVAEEAVYMSRHSRMANMVYQNAWRNVRSGQTANWLLDERKKSTEPIAK